MAAVVELHLVQGFVSWTFVGEDQAVGSCEAFPIFEVVGLAGEFCAICQTSAAVAEFWMHSLGQGVEDQSQCS